MTTRCRTAPQTKSNNLLVCFLSDCASASCYSAVSHSVMSEMQVIEQESPIGAKSSSRSKLDMFDEPGFTSGPPKCVSASYFTSGFSRDRGNEAKGRK